MTLSLTEPMICKEKDDFEQDDLQNDTDSNAEDHDQYVKKNDCHVEDDDFEHDVPNESQHVEEACAEDEDCYVQEKANRSVAESEFCEDPDIKIAHYTYTPHSTYTYKFYLRWRKVWEILKEYQNYCELQNNALSTNDASSTDVPAQSELENPVLEEERSIFQGE